MDADQRFLTRRGDVLVYQSAPLQEDITVAGALSPHLWVSTSGTDSDFDVKLIDVYPMDFPNPEPNPKDLEMGGYQQMVRGEPFRGKFRNSFEKPEPFVPESALGSQLRLARHQPHLPPRPPHHDPDPKLLVPPNRPQPPKIHQHSRSHPRRLPKSHRTHLPLQTNPLHHHLPRPEITTATAVGCSKHNGIRVVERPPCTRDRFPDRGV